MKTPKLLLTLFTSFLLLVPFVLIAATNVFDPGTAPLPTDVQGYWEYGIALITPVLVWLVARLGPRIPVMVLPLLAPVLAIGLGLIINKLTEANLSWVDLAKAGALAVYFRELVNQLVVKRFTKEPIKMTGDK